VRIYGITRHPLWLDEYFSLQHSAGRGHGRLLHASSGVRAPSPDLLGLQSRAPYPEIWRGMVAAPDVHPPLFQIVLRVWRDVVGRVVGESDAMLRALAVLFGLASIAVLFDVARLLHGTTAALWAALIAALAAPQIHWAQDARPYTLLLALALGAIDAVVRLERFGPGRLRAAALWACTLAAALTHYYALPALFALGCYAAVRLRGRARAHAGVALFGGVITFALMWGPAMAQQLRTAASEAGFLSDAAPGHLLRTAQRLALLPARSLSDPPGPAVAVAYLGAIVFALPLLLRRRRPDLAVWGWWLAGAVAPALVFDLTREWKQLEYLRYTSLALPAFYVIVAAAVSAEAFPGRRWFRHVVPAAAALSCALALPQTYATTQTPKPDFPHLARTLASHAAPGDVLVFYQRYDGGYPLLWYLALSRYAPQAMPDKVVFLTGPPDERARDVLREARSVWVVCDPGEVMPVGVTDNRVAGEWATGFNLPLLQRWVRTDGTSSPTTRTSQ
jgi:hypothetical protein